MNEFDAMVAAARESGELRPLADWCEDHEMVWAAEYLSGRKLLTLWQCHFEHRDRWELERRWRASLSGGHISPAIVAIPGELQYEQVELPEGLEVYHFGPREGYSERVSRHRVWLLRVSYYAETPTGKFWAFRAPGASQVQFRVLLPLSEPQAVLDGVLAIVAQRETNRKLTEAMNGMTGQYHRFWGPPQQSSEK